MTTVQETISLFEHTRLPFTHVTQHPTDMADLRLSTVKENLEIRLENLSSRVEMLFDAFDGQDIDPTDEDPRLRRLADIYERAERAHASVQTRLYYVKQALTMISDATCESHDHRLKAIKARKKRAGK